MGRSVIFIVLMGMGTTTMAQIPVEIFAGQERTTIDLIFFRYFKDKQGGNSPWLFFNRNRASVDYRMTETTYLPQFGFTEAISYNHEKLKGFAPVLVAQIFGSGVYPKAGIQYAFLRKHLTVFTWFVCEALHHPDLDYFLLFRYAPKLTQKIDLFTQAESINTFPTVSAHNLSFTQRLRFGIQFKTLQVGAGADFSQTGNSTFVKLYNIGGFIRHEF